MADHTRQEMPVVTGPMGASTYMPPNSNATDTCRTVMVIDGSYATIGARRLPGGRIDFVKFREELERQAACRFRECWFFDQEPVYHKSPNQASSAQYTALKLAPPHGPQFQLKLYAMKKYACHCRQCGSHFTQNVQKGVDNGIATKILSLAYENVCDRFILFAGDGDFYDTLNQIKNVLRKDLWVIGYRNSMSADLQQIATHVIWLDDLWPSIQVPAPPQAQAPLTAPPANGLRHPPPIPQAANSHPQPAPACTPAFAPPRAPPPPMIAPASTSVSHAVGSGGTAAGFAPKRELEEDLVDNSSSSPRAREVNLELNGLAPPKKKRISRPRIGRQRRRFRAGAGSPTRSLPRDHQDENDDNVGEDGQPLFFVDTGAGSRRSGRQNHQNVRWKQYAAPAADAVEHETIHQRRGEKRKRDDPPSGLMFELSDMSSEEDEQHPAFHRPKSPVHFITTNHLGQDVIDLASDSE